MPVVLDSSMVISWLIDDERDMVAKAAAAAVVSNGAVVPALWRWEVQNALLAAERRKRIDPAGIEAALTQLAALPISVNAAPPLFGPELDIARRMNISVYGAAYLELALSRGAQLMTRDERLADAARTLNMLWKAPAAKRRRRGT
ncbi:MAG TPA: type II toxin-antitoxin system VapC family toxin [Candidatus Baltobacteraceae bacterium]|nr:type II toxin-antitoxin system VapC family toxin [Candidatus Baltobacteraceae bacterium]